MFYLFINPDYKIVIKTPANVQNKITPALYRHNLNSMSKDNIVFILYCYLRLINQQATAKGVLWIMLLKITGNGKK